MMVEIEIEDDLLEALGYGPDGAWPSPACVGETAKQELRVAMGLPPVAGWPFERDDE